MSVPESEQGIYCICPMSVWDRISPKNVLFPTDNFVQNQEKKIRILLLKYWDVIIHQLVTQRKVDKDSKKSLATGCNKENTANILIQNYHNNLSGYDSSFILWLFCVCYVKYALQSIRNTEWEFHYAFGWRKISQRSDASSLMSYFTLITQREINMQRKIPSQRPTDNSFLVQL